VPFYEEKLKAMVEEHVKETQSRYARNPAELGIRGRSLLADRAKEMLDKLRFR
jgi:hypothetical protein